MPFVPNLFNILFVAVTHQVQAVLNRIKAFVVLALLLPPRLLPEPLEK